MRTPLSFLREHAGLDPATPPAQVLAALVRVGLEEEAVHGGDITGPVVVGEVLSAEPEPQKNGKTISWCQVRVGPGADDVRGIVCGAHNFGVGDQVVVALPGSQLPGGFAIAARKTYGHVSDGMICSARELGLGDDHEGIVVLSTLGLVDLQPGTDAISLLGLDEVTIEVNVTPDRGYCFSLRGVAREYALATGAAFSDPVDPAVVVPPGRDGAGHPVRIEDEAPVRGQVGCDRYVARTVRGVDATAPTPMWMQRVLRQCGMRSISLAVDVTNYVMLATGQPLHAFDLASLAGPVVVRRARAGERLTTLDDVDRALHAEDLLITDEAADGTSRVLAIAGVMGGASSEVSPGTTDLLVESAHFDPITVARSARRHKLATEASRRFERGVDTDLADRAAELAVSLLTRYGGGDGSVGVTDVDDRQPVPSITMRAELPRRLIGLDYADSDVDAALRAVGCEVTRGEGVVEVLRPSWRPDLVEGADLVEEVARVHGYDRIPVVVPRAPSGRGLTRSQHRRRSAARTLADAGLVEVLSYPFVAAERQDAFMLSPDDERRRALRLVNPLSAEQPLLRTSVLSTLVDVARRNLSRGARDLALFEIGLVYRPSGEPVTAPVLPAAVRPTAEQLAALEATVPSQPRHAALLLSGHRERPGWWGPGRVADWSDAVAVAVELGAALGVDLEVTADECAPWHPGRCARLTVRGADGASPGSGTPIGHAGELHPRVVAALELAPRTCAAEVDLDAVIEAAPDVVRAQPFSTHPVALRDIALVVDASVPAARVEAALRAGGGPLLEDVRLFDEYRGSQVGAGERSLAYHLVLRSPDRTLTGEQAEATRDAAVAEAAARTGATIRAS
jgi:phenylalanyl-tRNA synthetase beta chain